MPPPLETEVKLGLPDRSAYDALCAALGGEIRARLQRNAFLDGPGGEISAARVALRVREERVVGDESEPVRAFVTLKSGGSATGLVHERIEWEAAVPLRLDDILADPARLLALPVDPIRELRRAVPGLDRLVPLGEFQNERRAALVALDVAGASGRRIRLPTLWEVDRTTFGHGPVEFELEVELPSSAGEREVTGAALAEAVKERLGAWGVPWRAQPLSKYARFRRYCLGTAD